MTTQFEHDTFRGVITSPNHAASKIEDLGFRFRERPTVIRLNIVNRQLLTFQLSKQPQTPTVKDLLQSINLIGKNHLRGVYIPEYHTHLTKTANAYTDNHENFHGYIAERKPANLRHPYLNQELTEMAATYSIDPQRHLEITTQVSQEEGLCEWVAIYLAQTGNNPVELQDALVRFRNITAGQKHLEDNMRLTDIPPEDSVDYFRLLQNASDEFVWLLNSYPKAASTGALTVKGPQSYQAILNKTYHCIQTNRYCAGFSFVRRFMAQALSDGFDKVETINWLITNPVTTLEQLQNYQQVYANFRDQYDNLAIIKTAA